MAEKLKTEKDTEKHTVTFTPIDGDPITVSLYDIPEEIRYKLALYGLAVKVQRSVAGKESGIAETVQSQIEALKDGKWNAPVAVGGKAVAKQAILETARKLPEDARREFWNALVLQGTAEKLGIKEEDLGL